MPCVVSFSQLYHEHLDRFRVYRDTGKRFQVWSQCLYNCTDVKVRIINMCQWVSQSMGM